MFANIKQKILAMAILRILPHIRVKCVVGGNVLYDSTLISLFNLAGMQGENVVNLNFHNVKFKVDFSDLEKVAR